MVRVVIFHCISIYAVVLMMVNCWIHNFILCYFFLPTTDPHSGSIWSIEKTLLESTTKLFELITVIIIIGVKTSCREAWELTGRLSVVRNRRLRVSACGRRKAGQQITVSRVWYRLKHLSLPLFYHHHCCSSHSKSSLVTLSLLVHLSSIWVQARTDEYLIHTDSYSDSDDNKIHRKFSESDEKLPSRAVFIKRCRCLHQFLIETE